MSEYNPEQLDDHQLMQRFCNGELPAFETLYGRHRQMLYRYVCRHVPGDSGIHLYQSLWQRAIRSRQHWQARRTAPRIWLMTLARQQLGEFWRLCPEGIELPPNLDALTHALSTLPQVQRDTLLLCHEGFSVEQVAELSSVAPQTVRSRLRLARRHLAQQLDLPDDETALDAHLQDANHMAPESELDAKLLRDARPDHGSRRRPLLILGITTVVLIGTMVVALGRLANYRTALEQQQEETATQQVIDARRRAFALDGDLANRPADNQGPWQWQGQRMLDQAMRPPPPCGVLELVGETHRQPYMEALDNALGNGDGRTADCLQRWLDDNPVDDL